MITHEFIVSFLAKMEKVRLQHGESAYQEALLLFAKESLRMGHQPDAMIEGLLTSAGLDWEAVKAAVAAETAATEKAPPPSTSESPNEDSMGHDGGHGTAPDMGLFMRALQARLPALKSQGQFTAFQASFEAFQATVNGILTQNKEAEAAGKEALGKSFEVIRQATDITRKLEDVPEAATSEEAEAFKRPPSEFGEYDIQRALITELGKVQTLTELDAWWVTNRQRVDQVKSPSLRNPLIDFVRERKTTLMKGQT